MDYWYKAGDQIAQLIVEMFANADAIEVDDLGTTERGEKSFESTHLNLKQTITAKEGGIKRCFLHAEKEDNEFFSATDISYHAHLIREREMLSGAHVSPVMKGTMKDSFLNKIRVAGKENEKWQERGPELVRVRESGMKAQNKWIVKYRLQYYKNRL